MAERLLLFLLFLTACNAGPEVLLENSVASVVRQEPPKRFDPAAFQEYQQSLADGTARTVLNGGARGLVAFLARTQVQANAPGAADPGRQSIVVALRPGVAANDPRLLPTVLEALGARLAAVGPEQHLVYLRASGLARDLLLADSQHPGHLTDGNALNQLDTAGVHLENTTGQPLQIEQATIDNLLPLLRDHFGDTLERVNFWLELESRSAVQLVPDDRDQQ